LFAKIGVTWGVGDGSTTFNLPNLSQSVVAGYDSTTSPYNAVGGTGGANSHTLTTGELPAHTHYTVADQDSTRLNVAFGADDAVAKAISTEPTNAQYRLDPASSGTLATLGKSSSVGSATPIDIRNKFVVLPYIIKR